ncbi:MAG TPA: RNA polymerase subunit sigma-70, partial [Hyphomonas sp.]|nr:RNA polymerase subunit sigma-70 [Hyphomonas sp.]
MPTLTHNGSSRPSSARGEDAVIQRLTECRAEFMRYFQRRLSRSEEAEDAFQDFCVKVLRAAWEPQDNGKVDAWLRRVLRNSLIDHYRRRAARQRGRDAYEAEPREMADTPETD